MTMKVGNFSFVTDKPFGYILVEVQHPLIITFDCCNSGVKSALVDVRIFIPDCFKLQSNKSHPR